MTKADEIAVLDEMIERLTPRSYMGPWLAALRSDLRAAMLNDTALPTWAELADARREKLYTTRQAAITEAATIRDQATRRAEATLTEAAQTVARLRSSARVDLERLIRQL